MCCDAIQPYILRFGILKRRKKDDKASLVSKKGNVFLQTRLWKTVLQFLSRCVFILKSISCAYHETLKALQGLMCCCFIKFDFFFNKSINKKVLNTLYFVEIETNFKLFSLLF